MGSSEAGSDARGQGQAKRPPRDKYHAAYFCFAFMGIGLLMPWNAFITAVDYFQYLYPDASVESVFPLAYNLPNFLAMLAMLPLSQGVGSRMRILVGYVLFLVVTVTVPLIDVILLGGDGLGTSASLGFTMFLVVIVGLADGAAQGSLFGAAGCLPPVYTQAVSAGTGVSGLFICLLRIVTKAAAGEGPTAIRTSSYSYFIMSAIVAAVCIVLDAFVMPSLPIIRFYSRASAYTTRQPDSGVIAHPMESEEEADDLTLIREAPSNEWKISYWMIIQHMRREAASLVMIYWVTLAIFPGFLAEDVNSVELGDWYPILLITGYNVGDVIGKLLPLLLVVPTCLLFPCSFFRGAFLPAFYFSAAYQAPPVVVELLTFFLGLTNGHLTACAMMSAPRGLRQPEAEQAGILSALFLVCGIVLGSITDYIWHA